MLRDSRYWLIRQESAFFSPWSFVFPSEFSLAGFCAAEHASPALPVVNVSVWLGAPHVLALESDYCSVRAE